jgi:hypothetical protein
MHFKPTAGCQISILIFENNCGGGLYKYPIKNISRTTKFFPLLAKLKVLPGSLTDLSA